MRKLTVALMVLSLILTGVAVAAAAELPQALQGVDLSVAKQVTDQEAQEVRGSALDSCNGPQYRNMGAECPLALDCNGPQYMNKGVTQPNNL